MKNVNTNTELKEIRKHGVPEFPLEFNIDDTRDYYNNDINWHWHREFELVYILEGCITCHITQKTYRLRQGEGILINSSVLHRFTSENYGIIADIIFLSDFLQRLLFLECIVAFAFYMKNIYFPSSTHSRILYRAPIDWQS